LGLCTIVQYLMEKVMRSNKAIAFLVLLSVCLSLSACGFVYTGHFDLNKLLVDVFDPQPGESILVMVDLPHGKLSDNETWASRREMAQEWLAEFQNLAGVRQLSVQPLLAYQATGSHNAPLPQHGEMDGQDVRLSEILSGTNLVIAMTEYSATAPLTKYSKQYSTLRAASMPMVTRAMQATALSADYRSMAQDCRLLADRLDRAQSAALVFTTGDELLIDLRGRQALVDDGQLHATKKGERVINLPSGETYIAPYEGEVNDQPSRTRGRLPLVIDNIFVLLGIDENRVTEVFGQNQLADERRSWFAAESTRGNIAELGLGCNERAVMTGNVLEDEKVFGVHVALGLSDHVGGITGVEDFKNPAHAVHQDVVYPFGGSVSVTSLVLEYQDGEREQIIRAGAYTVLPRRWSITLRQLYLVWVLLVAGSLNLLVWGQRRRLTIPASLETLRVVAVLILGPLALLVYFLVNRRSAGTLSRNPGTVDWRIALSSALNRAVAYTSWLFIVLLLLVILLPNPGPLHILILVYLLPFCVGLLVLGYASNASKSSLGYWLAVRRAALREFVAINLSCASMFLTFFLLENAWFPGQIDFTDPAFWFMVPIVGLSGMVVFFPYYFWLAPPRMSARSEISSADYREFETGGLEAVSLRNTWSGILVSLGLFIGSLWLMITRMR